MRRLNFAGALLILAGMSLAGCRGRDPVPVQSTEVAEPVLQSMVHVADPKVNLQLVSGFHQVEQNSWRWTRGKFSVTLRVPPGAPASGAQLSLKLAIPEAILSRVKTTTLTAAIAQKPVGSADYTTPGEYVFKADVPSSLLSSEAVTVDFTLSKYLPGGSTESRELGVIVSSVSLDAK